MLENYVQWAFCTESVLGKAKVTMKHAITVCSLNRGVELLTSLRYLSFRKHKDPQHCVDRELLWALGPLAPVPAEPRQERFALKGGRGELFRGYSLG